MTEYLKEKVTLPIAMDLRHFASALAKETPDFPEKYQNAPGVVKYLEDRYPAPESDSFIPDNDEILAEYDKQNSIECGKIWASNSRKRLKDLSALADGILNVTPKIANTFLTDMVNSGSKPATRNRALVVCNKFFKEMVRIDYIKVNPFAGIKQLKEERPESIAYCTLEERERVLEASRAFDRPDWLAVAIAFYAGCRRGEIFRLRWEDVNFSTRRLTIRISKTGKRFTPISKELLSILKEHKKDRGLIVPAVTQETWQNHAENIIESIHDVLCLPESPNLSGKASGPKGKKKYAMTEDAIKSAVKTMKKQIDEFTPLVIQSDKDTKKSKSLALELACLEQVPSAAYDGKSWLPAERIGWNAFRHTFATLRAQAGVSLDKISSWMGNTPEVCRRHYTQFMPRDRHDEDIDK